MEARTDLSLSPCPSRFGGRFQAGRARGNQVKVWMLPATYKAIKSVVAKAGTNPSRWMVGLAERELRKASIL